MLQHLGIRTEKIGIVISVICALHCFLMPVALVYMGQHSINHSMHGAFDIIILGLATIFMGFTVFQSKNKSYYNKIIALLILGGLSFLTSYFVPSPINHFLFVAGSIFWLIAHLINYKNHRSGSVPNV